MPPATPARDSRCLSRRPLLQPSWPAHWLGNLGLAAVLLSASAMNPARLIGADAAGEGAPPVTTAPAGRGVSVGTPTAGKTPARAPVPEAPPPSALGGGDATGRPIPLQAPGDGAQPAVPARRDPGPAPHLVTTDPAAQQQAAKLIRDLDSPASEIANRAYRDLVALDGGAVTTINAELVTQTQLHQRGSLNLQHQLRAALQTIALQIPDSYRRQLLVERREAAAERDRIVRQVLGRHEQTHPTAAEIQLRDIPTRVNLDVFGEILKLPGDWPARFLEKFLLAGGLAIDAGQFDTRAAVDLAATPQALFQRRMLMQQMQMAADDAGNPVLDLLTSAPSGALRRIEGDFFLQWQMLMQKLYPDPAVQAASVAITRRGLVGRTDPAALDWARAAVQSALGDTVDADEAATDDNPWGNPRADNTVVGLAIEMLGQGARPADLELLRDLAFRPVTPWRNQVLEALRLHWNAADIPHLVKLIHDANRTAEYPELIATALSLENPQLDAAVAAREDWFGMDGLTWLLQQYVLARGTPAVADAALKAWTTEDSLNYNAQVVAMALRRSEYYPKILASIYTTGNDRLNYDVSLSPVFFMLAQDPEAVKPWLYALNDILALGRKDYVKTAHYDQALFDKLKETFKDATTVNTVYMRTHIVAEARLLLAVAGDKDMEALVSRALDAKVDRNAQRQMDFDQILLMWYCRMLPQYPLPTLLPKMDKVDMRYYGGRADVNRPVTDPDQVRQELGGNQQGPFWYNQQRTVGRRVFMNRNGMSAVPQMRMQPLPPLNYSYEPRVQAAIQYHVPELAAEILRNHPADFADSPLRTNVASSLGDIAGYAQAATLYESFLVDLPGHPPRVTMRDINDGQLSSICNNLSWLYATALDKTWCKPDRAVMLAEESVRLQPGMSYSVDTRAYAYLVAGRYAEALADFEASARLLGLGDTAGLASSLARQARALHGLKRDDEALKRLDLAVTLHPIDGETLLWIARGYGLIGQNDRALQLLAQAEQAGYMFHEQVSMSPEFEAIHNQRLYQNVLDNMKRHRKLIRDVVVECTPVSQVPAEVDRAPGSAADDAQDEANNPNLE